MDAENSIPFKLSTYGVSTKSGFLPEFENILHLPSYYDPWEDLLSSSNDLKKARRLRKEIESLSILSVSELKETRQWNRAYVVLSFLAHGYIWAEGEKGITNILPASIAVPWVQVSTHLDLPPVITYAGCVLYNFKLKDTKGPLVAENLEMLTTFTGTRDEEWFYIGSLLVEIEAVKGLVGIEKAYEAILSKDNQQLSSCLTEIHASIKSMADALLRMKEECNPSVFYQQIRLYFNGTNDAKVFAQPFIFDGVDPDEQVSYGGASAGQSSTLPAFDAFLDVQQHESYFEEQMKYMPPEHRSFIKAISKQPSVRIYIENTGSRELAAKYNECIKSIAAFRNRHFGLVKDYIIQQSRLQEPNSQAKGTGGTENLEKLLQGARENSEKRLIKLQ